MNNDNQLVILAKNITGWGLKGMIKAFSLVEDKESYSDLSEVYIGESEKKVNIYNLSSVKQVKKHLHFKIRGIDSIDQINSIKGKNVYIPKNKFKKITDDKIYFHQIKGLIAIDIDGNKIGIIDDLIDNNIQPILVISSVNWGEVLIPVIEETIIYVDHTSVKLRFNEELLYLNKK